MHQQQLLVEQKELRVREQLKQYELHAMQQQQQLSEQHARMQLEAQRVHEQQQVQAQKMQQERYALEQLLCQAQGKGVEVQGPALLTSQVTGTAQPASGAGNYMSQAEYEWGALTGLGSAQVLQPINKIDRAGGGGNQFSMFDPVPIQIRPVIAHNQTARQDNSRQTFARAAPPAPPGLGPAHNGHSHSTSIPPAANAGVNLVPGVKGAARGFGKAPPGGVDDDESPDDSSDGEARRREARNI